MAYGRRQVHIVESRAAQRYQFHAHFGQLADGFGVGRVVHEYAHRIGPRRQRYVLRVQVAPMIAYLESVGGAGPVERFAVIGLYAEKGDFHSGDFFPSPLQIPGPYSFAWRYSVGE